jgi:3-phenylpropionate/trans-cinnamate dioxygenase ferredoxin subunit
MNFVKVAQVSEIAAGSMKKVLVAGQEMLLANVEGKFYAIPSKCPHLGGDLSKGTLSGEIVTCPRHGAKFNVGTGQAVGDATVVFLKIRPKDARSYPVKVEGSDILLGTD